MPVKFMPSGFLDINTDPALLPAQLDGKNEISGAMTRCTNLNLDEPGVAKTRDGSRKLNATAIAQTNAHLLMEMDGNRYLFAGTVIYKNETSLATGLSSSKWRGIKYNSFNDTTMNIFALNGTNRKRIDSSEVNEWGITAPSAAPTVAVGALTGLTGTYKAKYTYVRKVGTTVVAESNPSAASSGVALVNQSLSITCVASSDSQVTHIRIYRTLTSGAVYYYDQEITGTTVDTNTADTALGTEVEIDHDRPPTGSIVIGPSYNGYCFILKDNLLYFCKANRPEYWPSTYYVEVSTIQHPLKAGEFFNGILYVVSDIEIFMIQGTGVNSFFPFPMSAITGALSQECILSVKGKGVFHVSNDGIYLFSLSEDKKISEEQFDPIFRGETRGNMQGINLGSIQNSWLVLFGNKLYFGYPGEDSTYPDNVLVINLLTNKTVHHNYSEIFRCVTVDRKNNRLLAVDNSGYIWQIEDPSMPNDNGTAIPWEIQSKSFSDRLYKYFPRSAKYDVELVNGGTCNGYILLSDEVKQSHSISKSRNTKKRLITSCTGDSLSIRLSGTGGIKIREVEVI